MFKKITDFKKYFRDIPNTFDIESSELTLDGTLILVFENEDDAKLCSKSYNGKLGPLSNSLPSVTETISNVLLLKKIPDFLHEKEISNHFRESIKTSIITSNYGNRNGFVTFQNNYDISSLFHYGNYITILNQEIEIDIYHPKHLVLSLGVIPKHNRKGLKNKFIQKNLESDYQLKIIRVRIKRNESNQPTGILYIHFPDEEEVQKARVKLIKFKGSTLTFSNPIWARQSD